MTFFHRFSSRKFFLFCFFFSGACGLVYQVAWLRVLSLVFGNTTLATSTILSSYMAGLGLGALYFGKRIESSTEHPIRMYARLEGGVALYAFLTPVLWKLIDATHIGFYRLFHPDYFVFALFKFFLAFLVLFLPTFLMGGTLPVAARFFVANRTETARYVGLLYALNTLGAVVGVIFSGFYALYQIGVWQTVYLAGLANALIYWGLRRFNEPFVPAVSSQPTEVHSKISWQMAFMLVLFGFSGAVSMMYEIGWTRILAIVLGSSTYAFSVMLATFLLGIALGSYLFSWAARRWKIDFFIFSVMQFLTAAAVLWGINLFDDIPYWFLQVLTAAKGNSFLIDSGRFLICSLIMFGPTLLIGALFTCFIHAYRGSGKLGRDVGVAYFSNTMGTILGAALTGFVIVPLIGIQKTLFWGAVINGSIGIASFLIFRENATKTRRIIGGVCLTIAVFFGLGVQAWDLRVISSDTAVNPWRVLGRSKKDFMQLLHTRETVFYKEGMSATVSVSRLKDNISLAVNGKVDASTTDNFTQYLLGHLPLLLHDHPKKVAVIGLGSASTVAAVAAHPVEQIDSVELEKAVVEASNFFTDMNRNVLQDPRVHQYINDGRNFLLVRPDKYDVIISEPSNPWIAGVANLFSREHFKTMRSRLNSGGVVCQWLHAYSMSKEDLAMIMRTFSDAFPYVQLWTSYYPDLMLIGFTEPRKIDLEAVKRKFDSIPLVKKDLEPHGVRSAEALFASFWLDDAEVRALAKNAKVHSDNLPRLEFSAPRSLYSGTLDQNYLFINSLRRPEFSSVIASTPLALNPYFYHEVVYGLIAKKMLMDAYQFFQIVQNLAPNDPRIQTLKGILDFNSKNFEDARKDVEGALAVNPAIPDAQWILAQVQLQAKAYPQALDAAMKALMLEPENIRYQETAAEAFYANDNFPQALVLFEKILAQKNGNWFDGMARIVDITLKAGDAEAKINALQRMRMKYPNAPETYLPLGEQLIEANRLPEAREVFEALLRLTPDNAQVYLQLARVYGVLGMNTEMKKSVRQAIRLNPSLEQNELIQKLLAL